MKVKRLFVFFADRHQHAWAERIRKENIDLEKENGCWRKAANSLPPYQITVSEDLIGVPRGLSGIGPTANSSRRINFSTAFAGQAVGIKEVHDNIWPVSRLTG